MRIPIAVLLVTSFLLLFGCNESGMGIFYSIEIEQPLNEGSLDGALSVSRFLVSGESYYALAGSLYSRKNTENATWTRIDNPAGRSIISSVIDFNGSIYAVATTTDAVESSLYRFTPDAVGNPWSGPIGLDTDASAGERVIGIAESDSVLLVNVRSGDDPDKVLFYSSEDGVGFTEVVLPVTTAPVTRSLTYGADTLLVAGNRLYSDTSGSFVAINDTNAPGPGETKIADIIDASALGALLVIAEDGTLYAYDGTSWLPPVEMLTGDLSTRQITRIAEISLGTELLLLLGTDKGYLEVPFSSGFSETAFASAAARIPGQEDPTTSGNDYQVIDLARNVILDIEVVAGKSLLFIGTGSAGLWRTAFNGESEKRWSLE